MVPEGLSFSPKPREKPKETSPTEVFEKTDQAVRIVSTLWDKRFEVLGQYFSERNKKRFVPFKREEAITAEIQGNLNELMPINEREEKVVEILERGAASGMEVLKGVQLAPLEGSTEEAQAIPEFNEKINLFGRLLQRYSELVSLHKSILGIEKELIASPDPQKFSLYIERMRLFQAEFEALNKEDISGLRKYFGDIKNDLEKVEDARKNGKPLEHLKKSLVSAVVRVIVANAIAGLIVGDPFKNPYFWQLTAATVPSVLAVNYVDYYFKAFTKLTDKITRLMSFRQGA